MLCRPDAVYPFLSHPAALCGCGDDDGSGGVGGGLAPGCWEGGREEGRKMLRGPDPRREREREKEESNLVDSASSHTLVSKIKPCMSKYKRLIR